MNVILQIHSFDPCNSRASLHLLASIHKSIFLRLLKQWISIYISHQAQHLQCFEIFWRVQSLSRAMMMRQFVAFWGCTNIIFHCVAICLIVYYLCMVFTRTEELTEYIDYFKNMTVTSKFLEHSLTVDEQFIFQTCFTGWLFNWTTKRCVFWRQGSSCTVLLRWVFCLWKVNFFNLCDSRNEEVAFWLGWSMKGSCW